MHNSYWLIWNGTHFLSRKWAWAFQITTPVYRLWLAVLLCSTIFYKDSEGHKDGKVKSEAKTFRFSPDGWNESPVFINIVFLEIDRKMWPRLFYKFLIHRGFISGLGTWSLLQQVSDSYRTEQVLSLHPVSSSSSLTHDLYCIHWSFQPKFVKQMHGSLRISPIMKLSGGHSVQEYVAKHGPTFLKKAVWLLWECLVWYQQADYLTSCVSSTTFLFIFLELVRTPFLIRWQSSKSSPKPNIFYFNWVNWYFCSVVEFIPMQTNSVCFQSLFILCMFLAE